MAEFLKILFGDKTLSFADFVQALENYNKDEANKGKEINLANLATGEYVGKGKYDSQTQELTKANELIAELRKGEVDTKDLQDKIAAHDTEVAQLKAQLEASQIEAEAKYALLKAKATDPEYLLFKLKENGKLERDEQGKIKNLDNMITDLQTSLPKHFETATNSDDGFVVIPNKQPKNSNTETEPQTMQDALKEYYKK